MKTITMDYETYRTEILNAQKYGFELVESDLANTLNKFKDDVENMNSHDTRLLNFVYKIDTILQKLYKEKDDPKFITPEEMHNVFKKLS